MGAIGGGIFQAVKGFRNAPSVSSVLLLCAGFSQIIKYSNSPGLLVQSQFALMDCFVIFKSLCKMVIALP